VDDHQTTNAQFLVSAGGGWLMPQAELTPQGLADWLSGLDRSQLVAVAEKASAQKKINATREVLMACEELAA
jgi:UDP-N-acetylglucosamine--N-acetylmuramyl-(pentapeptide) pyrophosphoryl-undecaprenol N-acetylglucosamine transferase